MKKRIIPSILLKSGSTNACLSQEFSPWRTVGTLAQQLKLHVSRGCDELLVINPQPSFKGLLPFSDRLSKLISNNTDIPVAYSGGIRNQATASECINKCFDKVFLTTSFLDSPDILSEIASIVGVQSVGVCLPYRCLGESTNRFVWDFARRVFLTENPLEYYIQMASECGAGEILLYSVDRDGTLVGFDEQILSLLQSCDLSRPVLLGGGAGKPEHFVNVLSSDLVQGVVASSIFSLTQETPSTLRGFCLDHGIPMRKA
jgi:cyclase